MDFYHRISFEIIVIMTQVVSLLLLFNKKKANGSSFERLRTSTKVNSDKCNKF